MARIFQRVERSVNFQEGSLVSAELSRNYHVMQYILDLEVTTDNASSCEIYNNNLFGCIERIDIVADGNQNIKQVNPAKFVVNNIINNGRRGKYTLDTGGNKTGVTQKATLTIDMIMSGEVRPMDTILNARRFTTLFLDVKWGTSAMLGRGITIKDAKLRISSVQLIGYQRNKGENISYYKEVMRTLSPKTDTTEFLIEMPVNKFYQGFLLSATNDGVLTDNIINNIRIKSGTTVFVDMKAETIQRFNELDFRIQKDENYTGLYYVDFTPRGRLSDVLNTMTAQGGFNTLEIILDISNVTESTQIDVFSDYVDITQDVENV